MVGLLTVGVLISSAIAGSAPENQGLRDAHVADIGFAAALVLAVVLVVSLLMQARPRRRR